MGFPQRLLADDERLVLVLRRHVKVIFAPVLLLIVLLALIGASFLVHGGAQPIFSLAVAVVALLIALRWVLWPIVVWLNTSYAVTTHRLIMRTGVFNRSGRDMPLSRLNDVSFEHGLIDRMLGCGTLMVESGGESGQLILTEIPKVELIQRTLYELAEDLRGVDSSHPLDPTLAATLDEEFGDEYRGPAAGGEPTDRGSTGHRS